MVYFLLLDMISAVPRVQGWLTCVVGNGSTCSPGSLSLLHALPSFFSLCSIGMPLAAFQVFEQLPSGSRYRTFYSWHPFLSHRCVGTAP